MKKLTIFLLSTLFIFMSFTNCFADNLTGYELGENENFLIDRYNNTMETSNGLLKILNVKNSKNEPLSNGHVIVYSYLENKIVFDGLLDENGRTNVYYQESEELILNSMKNEEFLDVQYLITVVKENEFISEGVTRTYYLPTESKSRALNSEIQLKDSILTKSVNMDLNLSSMDLNENKTVRFEESNAKFLEEGIMPLEVVETKDLGNKSVKVAKINTTKNCSIGMNLSYGTEVTLEGEGVLTTSFTKNNSVSVGISEPIKTSSARLYNFFTSYKFVEEHIVINSGGYHYDWYQTRPDKWVGGLTYSYVYEPANDRSYSQIVGKDEIPYYANTYVAIENGESFSIGVGAAGTFSSPFTGQSYSLGLSLTTTGRMEIYRNHIGPGTFYEYGNGSEVVDRNIIIVQ